MNVRRKRIIKFCMATLLMFMCGYFAIIHCKTTTVQAAELTKIKVSNRTYYLKNPYGSNRSYLYQKTSGGNKLVARISRDLSYRFVYGKKIYFSSGNEGATGYTYSYTVGKSGFRCEKSSFYTMSHRGKYAVGYVGGVPGNPVPSPLGILNLSTKKIKKLGNGCDIKFIGQKIYYATISNDRKTMRIICCNASGSSKKVIKTFRAGNSSKFVYVFNITCHQASYYNEKWQIRTVRY